MTYAKQNAEKFGKKYMEFIYKADRIQKDSILLLDIQACLDSDLDSDKVLGRRWHDVEDAIWRLPLEKGEAGKRILQLGEQIEDIARIANPSFVTL